VQVDVDSNGRKCKERMLQILSRAPNHEQLYVDFQVCTQGGRAIDHSLYHTPHSTPCALHPTPYTLRPSRTS
jgi:hypothetical protein